VEAIDTDQFRSSAMILRRLGTVASLLSRLSNVFNDLYDFSLQRPPEAVVFILRSSPRVPLPPLPPPLSDAQLLPIDGESSSIGAAGIVGVGRESSSVVVTAFGISGTCALVVLLLAAGYRCNTSKNSRRATRLHWRLHACVRRSGRVNANVVLPCSLHHADHQMHSRIPVPEAAHRSFKARRVRVSLRSTRPGSQGGKTRKQASPVQLWSTIVRQASSRAKLVPAKKFGIVSHSPPRSLRFSPSSHQANLAAPVPLLPPSSPRLQSPQLVSVPDLGGSPPDGARWSSILVRADRDAHRRQNQQRLSELWRSLGGTGSSQRSLGGESPRKADTTPSRKLAAVPEERRIRRSSSVAAARPWRDDVHKWHCQLAKMRISQRSEADTPAASPSNSVRESFANNTTNALPAELGPSPSASQQGTAGKDNSTFTSPASVCVNMYADLTPPPLPPAPLLTESSLSAISDRSHQSEDETRDHSYGGRASTPSALGIKEGLGERPQERVAENPSPRGSSPRRSSPRRSSELKEAGQSPFFSNPFFLADKKAQADGTQRISVEPATPVPVTPLPSMTRCPQDPPSESSTRSSPRNSKEYDSLPSSSRLRRNSKECDAAQPRSRSGSRQHDAIVAIVCDHGSELGPDGRVAQTVAGLGLDPHFGLDTGA